MRPEQTSSIKEYPAPPIEKTRASWNLAVVSLMNGSRTGSGQELALQSAQRLGVTTLQFLHMRLLLAAGLATAWGDDNSDDD